jgi:hypothetical protein
VRALGVVAALLWLLSGCANAQQGAGSPLNFKIGDDVARVKQALGTNAEPEEMQRTSGLPANMDPNRGKAFIHLRTRGIWVFFRNDKLEAIRLDAPYAGQVRGIGIGDPVKKVRATLGPPQIKPWSVGMSQAYRYALNDDAYLIFHVNPDDEVQIIFISK